MELVLGCVSDVRFHLSGAFWGLVIKECGQSLLNSVLIGISLCNLLEFGTAKRQIFESCCGGCVWGGCVVWLCGGDSAVEALTMGKNKKCCFPEGLGSSKSYR